MSSEEQLFLETSQLSQINSYIETIFKYEPLLG